MDTVQLIRQRADAGDPEALKIMASPFHEAKNMMVTYYKRLLEQGDPDAHACYAAHQRSVFGPDPLADGAHEWPAELTDSTPGQGIVEVPADAPLTGWRMWFLSDDGDLVAPYLATVTWRGDLNVPGVRWQPGVNENSTHTCLADRERKGQPAPEHHPDVAPCGCGIRAVQSLTVMRAYAESNVGGMGLPSAIAEIDVWGRIAGPSYADDWGYTLRAQYGRLLGMLLLHRRHEAQAQQVAERYGVEVALW